MTTQPTKKTVADLTVAELKEVIRETVTEALAEIVGHPDEKPEPCQDAGADAEQATHAAESQAARPATGSRIHVVTDEAALSAKMARKVGDLAIDDFRFWIHQIVGEVGEDLIGDPDEGLEFTEEFAARLDIAIAEVEAGMTIPAEEVYRRLGWD